MTERNTINYANLPDKYGDASWLVKNRFGLFIHWGLYALPARHEWVMSYEKIHSEYYQKYFEHFEPDLFDAEQWAKAAKKAGMKYLVITTKHHEGFALWDSKLTDFKVTNTPINRDLLGEVVESFRAKGLKIGFYHSLLDWHHPEFPVDGLHPQREDEEFRKQAKNRDITKYTEYMHGQVRELLTEYGKIDYLWFDFSYPQMDWQWAKGKGPIDWQSEKLEQLVSELQPHILLNNRLGLNRGVNTSPEQVLPEEELKEEGQAVVWESCQTMNGSWGYHRDNLDWKPSEMLIKMLIDAVSKNGNLLLNIGPNGRGEFDKQSLNRLSDIGEWVRLHSRSIYGAGPSRFPAPVDCRYTQKGNRLYLHILSWPLKHIQLEGLDSKVEYAQILNDASEVLYKEPDNDDDDVESNAVTLKLPIQKPDVMIPVVELFLKD